MNQIRIGDYVSLKPAFGMADVIAVEVTGLTLTDAPRSKYGDEVDSVSEDDMIGNRCLVSYRCADGSGRWAYAEQVVQWCTG